MSNHQEPPFQLVLGPESCRWGYLILAHGSALLALILAQLPAWYGIPLLMLLIGHGFWHYRHNIQTVRPQLLSWTETVGWSLRMGKENVPLLSSRYLDLGYCLLLSCQMAQGHHLLFLTPRYQSCRLRYLLRHYAAGQMPDEDVIHPTA
jgi:hypothetical protein